MGRWAIAALLFGAIATAIAIFLIRRDRDAPAEAIAEQTTSAAVSGDLTTVEPSTTDPAALASAPVAEVRGFSRAAQTDNSRISNGEKANPRDYPWIAAIGQRDQQGNVTSYCAGTLIAPEWLVTAAHCKVLEGEHAVLGRFDLSTTTGQVIEIVKVISHPSYDKRTLDYDIALAKLASAVGIEPIKLMAKCEPPVAAGGGAAAIDTCEEALKQAGRLSIAGWGRLGAFNYALPDELQKADVKVASHATCVSNYAGANRVVTSRMFCAHGTNAAGQITDACKGDSGGPIVAHNFNRTRATLVGIISKGKDCSLPEYPGIYADMSKLRSWVELCMKQPEDSHSC
jgi:secreted trypsin-like serine protease